LQPQGRHAESLFAFQRRLGSTIAVVAVPRLSTRLVSTGQFSVGIAVWGDTTLALPDVAPGTRFENWFTGKTVKTLARRQNAVLLAGEVFANFPVALLLHLT
jgi:(1->4)-alpha-D-glucan 1-alpha-D-glucosylmutase